MLELEEVHLYHYHLTLPSASSGQNLVSKLIRHL